MSFVALRVHAKEIAVRVVDRKYEDPFWLARFGARGRVRSEEDIAYHVDYLAQAIEADDAGILERYALWLRGVLTSRGMCTLHLDESFAQLEVSLPDDIRSVAASYIQKARSALRHENGPAGEIDRAASSIVRAFVESAPANVERRVLASAVAHRLSYLADALAENRAVGEADPTLDVALTSRVDEAAASLSLAVRESLSALPS
ncbi:MAG TPA: hypothetical protein VF407_23190 [Polyangiaceae bacterium]